MVSGSPRATRSRSMAGLTAAARGRGRPYGQQPGSRRLRICRRTETTQQTLCSSALDELLLCCVERGALVNGLVAGEGARGRGLFASRNVEAGERLLCVPLALGLREPHELPPSLARENWYSRLACTLLQERALGSSSPFVSYLATLPEHIGGSPLLVSAFRLVG